MKKGNIAFNTMTSGAGWILVIITIVLLALVFLYALNTISPTFEWWN